MQIDWFWLTSSSRSRFGQPLTVLTQATRAVFEVAGISPTVRNPQLLHLPSRFNTAEWRIYGSRHPLSGDQFHLGLP